MKVSDYIVTYLAGKGITDVFGYPGGMVTYLMESFHKYRGEITAHVNYHEQGSAFAACGYAQAALRPGVAYGTSGPGATNMFTGIANAFFDSTPTIFITGQVNTYESKAGTRARQKGFQEMDVVAAVDSYTKYSAYVESEADIRYHLEKAYHFALEGRPGPVLLDIPMNVQRQEVTPEELRSFTPSPDDDADIEQLVGVIADSLGSAERPVVIAGAGIQAAGMGVSFNSWIEAAGVPVVTSMLAVDLMPGSELNYGFIGAYGDRAANFLVAKADLVVSIGSRLDIRQTGADLAGFAPGARLIRVDIDPCELTNRVKEDETQLIADLRTLLPALLNRAVTRDFASWISVANELREQLDGYDHLPPNDLIAGFSALVPSNAVVTTDVGQNQVWVAQSFKMRGQRVLFSGGHGAMGYSLPAAIGAYYATRDLVVAFTGDGGIQMNIQELQFLAREQIPVKIVLVNNNSLGMIRHFQEMYFDQSYVQTVPQGGFTLPDFGGIAAGYRIPYVKVADASDLPLVAEVMASEGPALIELLVGSQTYVYPKLAMGKEPQDQEPELPRELYTRLNAL